MAPSVTVTRLAWQDIALGEVTLPKATLRLTFGLGSGLARRPGSRKIWAVGDRGPNLKVKLGRSLGLKPFRDKDAFDAKAKIMPRLDIGPALAELRFDGDTVRHVRTLRLCNAAGRPISGLPIPSFRADEVEDAYDLDGRKLAPDPEGADPEAIVALSNGEFWVAEEYGPSLLHVGADGRILRRLVPRGSKKRFAGAGYPILPTLPARAVGRLLNRGYEGLAVSPDEAWLYVAFQSPLDAEATADRRHAPIWKLDAKTGALAGEILYRFDKPKSFLRDKEAEHGIGWGDLKIGDIALADASTLLVVERITRTAKIYAIDLATDEPEKRLILSTDDHPEIAQDIEGLAVLSKTALLLVTDNDFGIEGAATSFWRIDLGKPISRF